jgi:Cu2+-exporting ATPase
MSCCTLGAGLPAESDNLALDEEMRLASRPIGRDTYQTDLSVPDIHCGACIQTIEKALRRLEGVEQARVNLSTKRVSIRWRDAAQPPALIETLRGLGYKCHLDDPDLEEKDSTASELLRALAVSGFAASNIMLLSVSIWSGADSETRDLFHWLSAFIALPALAYSGRVFFRSAWESLRHGRTNMDVPISIGVLLAFGMSLYDTVHHGQHAYFDASISLLFFLLIGRTLDHMMREKARVAVKGLARLSARGALVAQEDGSRLYLPVAEIRPGMTIWLAAGERVPVDARVEEGSSDIDVSLVSGEGAPQAVSTGSVLQAGTLNLTGPLTITALAAARDSFLAEMVRLMEAAESGRTGYRRVADRAASLYAPVVHLAGFLSFVGWMIATGDVHRAVTIAVAVLIITCPCALGLAVPMVQVVAARRLFENGIMVKDGSAMERLAEIDAVVFDKTGTLTSGHATLANRHETDPENLAIAAAMATRSRHPYSRALAAACDTPVPISRIDELPGLGVEARVGNATYRLGRREWAVDESDHDAIRDHLGTVLSKDGKLLAAFRFDDALRAGAREAVASLRKLGLAMEIVSGDRYAAVEHTAADLRIPDFRAGVLPGDKTRRVAELSQAGRRVLMVGDGLNDAPALTAAHASMAPGSAADIGRNAADFVFLRDGLEAVPLAIGISRRARLLVRQNFGLAIAYNAVALPVAILGYVTPLVAAFAMSLSSILVVANALRLKGDTKQAHDSRRDVAGVMTIASEGNA